MVCNVGKSISGHFIIQRIFLTSRKHCICIRVFTPQTDGTNRKFRSAAAAARIYTVRHKACEANVNTKTQTQMIMRSVQLQIVCCALEINTYKQMITTIRSNRNLEITHNYCSMNHTRELTKLRKHTLHSTLNNKTMYV